MSTAQTDMPTTATPPITGPDPLSYVEDAEPFSEEVQTILATKVNPEVVEVRSPGDLLYVPWIHYQTILVQAFGVGGFRMVPKRPARQQGNVFTWEGSLWVRPPGSRRFQFVDEAVGECGIQSAGNGPEGAKSDCLTKCCKRLNIFMELFDPAWRRWWEGNYKGKHQASKGKREWVERGRAAAPAPAAAQPGADSAGASTAVTNETAPSTKTLSTIPASGDDPGEAATNEQLDAIAGEIKRRRWKTAYTVVWLQQNFGVAKLGALSEQQAARALVDIMKRPLAVTP